MKKIGLRLFAMLFAFLTVFLLASCSRKSYEGDFGSSGDAPGYGNENGGWADGDVDSSVKVPDDAERKIIKTYDISSETKAYETAVASLKEMISNCGGYVESSSSSDKSLYNSADDYNRYATYTIRIPAERAEEFVNSVGSLLNVTSSNSYVEDVSETYYSIEARLEELQAERDSLMDIMNAPETKKDYNLWLTVNERLSDVRQQIAVYQGQLNRFDGKISYSTVKLSIREVISYSDVSGNSFGTRLGNSFVNGWKNFGYGMQEFAIWFVGAMPVLLLLAVIAAVVIVIILTATRKQQKKQGK